jgi:hypothetical protein
VSYHNFCIEILFLTLVSKTNAFYEEDGIFDRWPFYPQYLREEWFDRELAPLPNDWKNHFNNIPVNERRYTGDRPKSERLGQYLLPKPLPKGRAAEIAADARTREDFLDYDVIEREPSDGRCLCELRIICGTQCHEFYRKGADGKTHKDGHKHWAWRIDMAPRGQVCPVAKQRINDGHYAYSGCREILIKPPTSAWVLEQHPDDPQGTIAGRVATDEIWIGPCPQCRYKPLIREDNELFMSQTELVGEAMTDLNFPRLRHDVEPFDLVRLPLRIKRTPGCTAHPWFEEGKLFAPMQTRELDPKDLWIDHLEISLDQLMQRQNEAYHQENVVNEDNRQAKIQWMKDQVEAGLIVSKDTSSAFRPLPVTEDQVEGKGAYRPANGIPRASPAEIERVQAELDRLRGAQGAGLSV